MLLYLRLNIYSKLPHYTPFVTVNGKKVVEADVEATNGVIDHYKCLLFPFINWTFQVIHFISDVIYPLPTTNTMADLLSTDERLETVRKKISKIQTPRFSTLWAALTAANLSEVAASEGPFTLFAPTNDAFAKVAMAST